MPTAETLVNVLEDLDVRFDTVVDINVESILLSPQVLIEGVIVRWYILIYMILGQKLHSLQLSLHFLRFKIFLDCAPQKIFHELKSNHLIFENEVTFDLRNFDTC